MSVKRTEELERLIGVLARELRSTKLRLQAVDDRVMAVAGGLQPIGGSASVFAFARADGSISASSGGAPGGGTVNFAEDNVRPLSEGTQSAEVENPINFLIADNAWLVVGRNTKGWFVLFPFSCDDLS